MKYSLLLINNISKQIDAESLESFQAARYWMLLVEQKLVELSFPSGDIKTTSDWLGMITSPDTMVGLVLLPGQMDPVAHITLTSFLGYSAMLHFSILRPYHGREAIKIGVETLENLSKFRRPDGTPYLETIIGLTPMTNRAACWYVKKIGMEKVDIIKHAYFIEKTGEHVDGLMTKRVFDNFDLDLPEDLVATA